MIKRIAVEHLEVGMFITDLNNDWIPHNNNRRRGVLRSEAVIEKIRGLGVTEVYIDTGKGRDSSYAVPSRDVDANNEAMLQDAGSLKPVTHNRVSREEEMIVAHRIHSEAQGLVSNVLEGVKLGKAIDLNPVNELSAELLHSVLRNHNAMTCLGRIREKDNYLLEHSVNLSVLMSIFGKSIGLPVDVMQQTVVGALLHDIGKILTPDEVLHKPGKLDEEEFRVMKQHVVHSRDLLRNTEGISELTILTAAQHHERMDGSGYPDGLKGEEISQYGRMVAITDVYDAITSDRVYHKGMTPSQGLKKLLEWSDSHLDRNLVHHFIRCIGLYPIGSLVLLESGRLGVVVETNEDDQRLPIVRVMYHTRLRQYIKVATIDLARPSAQDLIVKAVDPEDYRIDIRDFLI